jgi:hypothetical protein
MYYNSNNTATINQGSNYPSLMLSGGQQQQQSFNYTYIALILEEAEKLYNKLTTELTNRVIAADEASMASPLPSLGNDNMQKLINNNNTYDEG